MQNKTKTIFILGAGASKPYGLPDGKELKDEIIKILSDPSKFEIGRLVMYRTGKTEMDLKEAADDFRDSGTESIDAFLSRRPKLLRIGKWTIAAIIGSREDPNETRKDEGNWARWLINKIYEGKTFHDYPLRPELIYFLTFNYDRSLEFIIYKTLRAKFRNIVTEAELSGLVTVPHLHGHLGNFTPFENKGNKLRYGEYKAPWENFPDIEKSLSMMYEFTNPEKAKNHYDNINHMLKESTSAVWFLGFGYHSDILKNFRPGLEAVPKIYGTALGLSDKLCTNVIKTLDREIGTFLDGQGTRSAGKVKLGHKDQDCLSFLKEHFSQQVG